MPEYDSKRAKLDDAGSREGETAGRPAEPKSAVVPFAPAGRLHDRKRSVPRPGGTDDDPGPAAA